MAEKILSNPEIWKIYVDLPDSPLKNLNSYVIKTEDGNLVIDTGYNRPECRKVLFDELEKLDVDLEKTSLFLTHFHSDHMGMVREFIEVGCRIYMGKDDYEYYMKIKTNEIRFDFSEIFLEEGMPEYILELQPTENDGCKYASEAIFQAVLVEDETTIQLGEIELEFICTPGHTPGHMMLYLPQSQVLFTGDHILFDITPNISAWKGMDDSLGDYMSSLQKVKDIPVKMALPGHRERHTGIRERIDQILQHHEDRLQEILCAVKKYPNATAYEIAGNISWSMKGKKWEEAPADQKWFAMGETLAHLQHLEKNGEVKRIKHLDKYRYI